MKTASYTIHNEEGLHARPATDFCETAMTFDCDIKLQKEGEDDIFEAKSIISILCMGAVKGETIIITTDGADEEAAIEALLKVLQNA
ncbi:HPr family phosphocarrier protein [Oscillospiraceae bacterium MB08-C2-2]|nr:HPr family phosphocarrier protein [Oscillospiraceae bacterium MB08-C2-2]